MDFSKLLYFKVLSETLNYTKAAEKLYISQSNLSEQIRKSEEEIGKPLFSRNRKNVSLTDEGKLFLEFCKKTLSEYEEVINKINNVKKKVKVGIIPSSSTLEWYDKLEKYNHSQDKISFECSLIPDIYLESDFKEKYDIWLGIENPSLKDLNFKQTKSDSIGIYSRRLPENIFTADIFTHKFGKIGLDESTSVLRKNGFKGNIIEKDSNDEIFVCLEKENTAAILYESVLYMDELIKIKDLDKKLVLGWYYKEKTPEIDWILNNL